MNLKLPDTIISKNDLVDLITEIRAYAGWYMNEAIKARVKAGHNVTEPDISPGAEAILRQWSAGRPLDRHGFDELLASLDDYARKAQSVAITLAAPPTAKAKAELAAWIRANISSDLLVSFDYNRNLLGGMVLRAGSRIFDFSFKSKLMQASDQIPGVLRRVR